MSKSFWDELASPYVLVFQSDSVFLRPPRSLDSLHDSYYVGAPWCPSNDILTKGVAEHPVGNGGLSLRSSQFMVQCIESLDVRQAMERKYEVMDRVNMSFTRENEDIFFSTCMTQLLKPAQVRAALTQSQLFAVEVPCGGNGGEDEYPDGLHATWYYVGKEKMDDYIDFSRRQIEASGQKVQSCQ